MIRLSTFVFWCILNPRKQVCDVRYTYVYDVCIVLYSVIIFSVLFFSTRKLFMFFYYIQESYSFQWYFKCKISDYFSSTIPFNFIDFYMSPFFSCTATFSFLFSLSIDPCSFPFFSQIILPIVIILNFELYFLLVFPFFL